MSSRADIQCWSCGKKLGWQEPHASGVLIPCPRCRANNEIVPLPLPSPSVSHALGMTGALSATF